ncbi:MAG: Nif3-like dinuclear metal center hexameric protein [Planctomycetota bacterium]
MNNTNATTVRDICKALDEIAPLHLAEDWDQVGLQVGDYDAKASKALACIDYTPAVLDETLEKGCDFVVAYHPPMFKALKRLTTGSDWKQDLLLRTVRERVAVYSPHTALDAVRGGFCDMLCELIAGGTVRYAFALEAQRPTRDEYKVVVFVPESDEASVRSAMSVAGAGGIGNYRECSFAVDGVGGFRPVEGANPTVGRVGVREDVRERRMEMLVPRRNLAAVLAALRRAHPYEEPAFDVFRLEPEPALPETEEGAGRFLCLEEPIDPAGLWRRLASLPGAIPKLAGRPRRIEEVAVCPGAGGSLFESVDADAYVTGEMQHHQVLDLVQQGKAVLLLGHTASERPLLPQYVEMIRKSDAGRIEWAVSEADVTPWEMR